MRQKSINERPGVMFATILIISILLVFVFEVPLEQMFNPSSNIQEDLSLVTLHAYSDPSTRSVTWEGYILSSYEGIVRKCSVNNQTNYMTTYPFAEITTGKTFLRATFTDVHYNTLMEGYYIFAIELVIITGDSLHAQIDEYFSETLELR